MHDDNIKKVYFEYGVSSSLQLMLAASAYQTLVNYTRVLHLCITDAIRLVLEKHPHIIAVSRHVIVFLCSVMAAVFQLGRQILGSTVAAAGEVL